MTWKNGKKSLGLKEINGKGGRTPTKCRARERGMTPAKKLSSSGRSKFHHVEHEHRRGLEFRYHREKHQRDGRRGRRFLRSVDGKSAGASLVLLPHRHALHDLVDPGCGGPPRGR